MLLPIWHGGGDAAAAQAVIEGAAGAQAMVEGAFSWSPNSEAEGSPVCCCGRCRRVYCS